MPCEECKFSKCPKVLEFEVSSEERNLIYLEDLVKTVVEQTDKVEYITNAAQEEIGHFLKGRSLKEAFLIASFMRFVLGLELITEMDKLTMEQGSLCKQ
jgi:hypothetical protein